MKRIRTGARLIGGAGKARTVFISITEPGMKALELVKRINRARRAGEDVSVLERELAAIEAYKPPKPPKKTKQQKVAEASPILATSLRNLLGHAKRRGKSLGCVMRAFKLKHGRFPPRLLWREIVGRDTRDAVIDAMVSKLALQVGTVRL